MGPASPSPELNAEFYVFVAPALRAFVDPWWTEISRYDKEGEPNRTGQAFPGFAS